MLRIDRVFWETLLRAGTFSFFIDHKRGIYMIRLSGGGALFYHQTQGYGSLAQRDGAEMARKSFYKQLLEVEKREPELDEKKLDEYAAQKRNFHLTWDDILSIEVKKLGKARKYKGATRVVIKTKNKKFAVDMPFTQQTLQKFKDIIPSTVEIKQK